MKELYCLFCQRPNKLGAVVCIACGARLIPQDDRLVAELQHQEQAFASAANVSGYEQSLRQLPYGALALFLPGRADPLVLPRLKSVVLGRDETPTDELMVDLSPFGRLAHSVSRRHATIIQAPGGFALNDLGSTNGTWLNQELLQPGKTYPLQNRDRVKLGLFTLVVCFQGDQEATQPVRMLVQGRNTLMNGQHLLSAPYLLIELAPYLHALAELQQVIALCGRQPAHELRIHEISEGPEGVAVRVAMMESVRRILHAQILPWRADHADFIGNGREETNAMLEEAVAELAGQLLAGSTAEKKGGAALLGRLGAALRTLVISPFEPDFMED